MSRRTLLNIGWRYLWHHPWQSVLMILGISLGVAVVVAVDLANASASKAFDLSTETIAGRATHQITGGPGGLDEQVYTRLRREGIGIPIAPIIIDYVSSPQLGDGTLQLLGVDSFAEAPFRSYLDVGDKEHQMTAVSLSSFLTQPGAVLISEELAMRFGLEVGGQITIEIAGRVQDALIVGLLRPVNNLSRRVLEGIILTDISTAQEFTGRLGKLDRIDLILTNGNSQEKLLEIVRSLLPSGAILQPVAARSGAVEQMTSAFRINLTALSLLALIVGMFLIYNTITHSVVQRREMFGTLRCLGATRREIFSLVMSEAFLVGFFGGALGIILGVVMGQGSVRMVTQTVNDLFFVVAVRGVQIPIASLVKGSLLGLLATLLTAAPPAWEAASVPPRLALLRSGLESKALRAINFAFGIGVALILIGVGVLASPIRTLTVSFIGTFCVIVGCAMLIPKLTGLFMRLLTPLVGIIWGTMGRMAPRDVNMSLSRTSVAVMALMVSVSVTIGISVMVSSFRATVAAWLSETLQGDIYISVPSPTATSSFQPIDPRVIEELTNQPGITRLDVLRSAIVDSPDGAVHIAATNNIQVGVERLYLSVDVPLETIWDNMLDGAVLVSEPFANRLGIPRQGGMVSLLTTKGLRQFKIIGIYYDYASTQGTILMALPVFQDLWDDTEITAIALRLEPGVEVNEFVIELQKSLAPFQRLFIRPNRELRMDALEVFDRTFAITSALQILATIVAFIGILSALLSLELERLREFGILRSVGMTLQQLWSLIFLETGLMGTAAGLFAMPTGYILSLILVYIINQRSFGWTLQMSVVPLPFIQALVLAIASALIAGIYPAYRIGKMVIAEALRSE